MCTVAPCSLPRAVSRSRRSRSTSKPYPAPSKVWRSGARPGGGELQRPDPGQFPPPVADLVGQSAAGQPLPLPECEVPVLNGQFGELGGFVAEVRGVAAQHLGDQDLARPAVTDTVVDHEEQDVVVVGDADQQTVDQGAGDQVEGQGSQLVDQPGRVLSSSASAVRRANGAGAAISRTGRPSSVAG